VPEVRSAFDEFGISAGIVRNEMVGDAARVLNAAAQEFAAYTDAAAQDAADGGSPQVTHGSARDPLDLLSSDPAARDDHRRTDDGDRRGELDRLASDADAGRGGVTLLAVADDVGGPFFIADTSILFSQFGALRPGSGSLARCGLAAGPSTPPGSSYGGHRRQRDAGAGPHRH